MSSSNLSIQFFLESTPKKLSLSPPLLRFQYANGAKPNDQFSINSFSFLPPCKHRSAPELKSQLPLYYGYLVLLLLLLLSRFSCVQLCATP